jgi:hypothetical protein
MNFQRKKEIFPVDAQHFQNATGWNDITRTDDDSMQIPISIVSESRQNCGALILSTGGGIKQHPELHSCR